MQYFGLNTGRINVIIFSDNITEEAFFMKRIKVAQIGTSRWSHGSGIWPTMANHPEVFELVGYALPENEREKFPDQMKCFEGYREMTVEEILSDPR